MCVCVCVCVRGGGGGEEESYLDLPNCFYAWPKSEALKHF